MKWWQHLVWLFTCINTFGIGYFRCERKWSARLVEFYKVMGNRVNFIADNPRDFTEEYMYGQTDVMELFAEQFVKPTLGDRYTEPGEEI